MENCTIWAVRTRVSSPSWESTAWRRLTAASPATRAAMTLRSTATWAMPLASGNNCTNKQTFKNNKIFENKPFKNQVSKIWWDSIPIFEILNKLMLFFHHFGLFYWVFFNVVKGEKCGFFYSLFLSNSVLETKSTTLGKLNEWIILQFWTKR